MFPIRDRRGRVIAFGGRVLGDGQPKYLNSPETALFRKRLGLYGLDLAGEAAYGGARVVVVEGYMDVIALHQAGFAGAVAPLGTALTAEQLALLWRITPEPVVCFDGDAAGARALLRVVETALPLITPEKRLRLAALPAGEDPDSLLAKQGAGAFAAVLEASRPLAEALYDLLAEGFVLTTPEQRAALRQRLEAAAGQIRHRALAAEYRRALRERFFAATRGVGGGRPGPGPSLLRPPIEARSVRCERARLLLAILVRHPWLIAQAEEELGRVVFPAGPAEQLKGGLLAWLAARPPLDSAALIAHLAGCGMGDALAWALAPVGLPAAARAEAPAEEAEQAFWHFFYLLRDEAELREDQKETARILAETNDPAAARRLILITQALAALQRGEVASVGGEST